MKWWVRQFYKNKSSKGQKNGKSGEEEVLEWEKFPYSGQSKTYNTDYQVPDSAATATALFTGNLIFRNIGDFSTYRGSPLSTIFGTWKKSYYAKFVLIESISTSTNSPTCTFQIIRIFINLQDHNALHMWSFYAPSPFHNRTKVFMKSFYNQLFIKW